MLVIRQHRIYRTDLQQNPNILYIFGDNLDRNGFGGQAAEMRGEPNAFGFATKRSISHSFPDDYFFDDQEDTLPILRKEYETLHIKLNEIVIPKGGGLACLGAYARWDAVVIPSNGIGTGLSRMPEFAPKALQQINTWLDSLRDL